MLRESNTAVVAHIVMMGDMQLNKFIGLPMIAGAMTLALPAPASYALAHSFVLTQAALYAQMPPMPWDQPPAEFKEVERQGFHAGVQAAINDYNHHREPDPERRKEFRNPHVKRSFAGDYRKGFRRGYNDAMRHMERTNGRHS